MALFLLLFIMSYNTVSQLPMLNDSLIESQICITRKFCATKYYYQRCSGLRYDYSSRMAMAVIPFVEKKWRACASKSDVLYLRFFSVVFLQVGMPRAFFFEKPPSSILIWDLFAVSGILLVTIFTIFAGIHNSMRWYMFGFVALFGVIAIMLIITWVMAYTEVSIPVRMSSLIPGTIARPGLYTLWVISLNDHWQLRLIVRATESKTWPLATEGRDRPIVND